MFSDFPNLHPLVVHFPIVLILLSAGLQALLVFKNWQQVRWGTLVIMAGGFAGALAASTIFHAMPEGLSAQATEVFNEHELYSGYTLWVAGITLLLRGIGEYFKIYRRSFEILVLVSALLAAVFLSLAGHRGAQLVYVEGVGPKGNLLMKGGHHGKEEMKNMEPGKEHQEGGHKEMDDAMSPQNGQHSADNMENMPGMNNPNAAHNMDNMPGMEKKTNSGNMNMEQGHDMQNMDQMKNMPGMDKPNNSGGKNTMSGHDMPGMDNMQNKNSMPGMQNSGNKKQSSGMTGMENMPGHNSKMENMKGMDMPGMKNQKDLPGMDKMKGMEMDKGKTMTDMNMPGMSNTPGMNMSSPMDTFRFEDNNPAFRNSKKNRKQ